MMFHSVRDLSQATLLAEDAAVELGRRRSEPRPSVSTVQDFYSSRPTRGDSARFLRTCEFEGSVGAGCSFRRSAIPSLSLSLFVRKLAVTPCYYARTRGEKPYV